MAPDEVMDPVADETASDAEATAEETLSLWASATERRGRAARPNFILVLNVDSM
jgi:hypothetical protein